METPEISQGYRGGSGRGCDCDTLARQQVHLVDMLIKFLPSFLGFLDGYTDANAIVIAAACDHPLAQAQPTAQNTPNKWSLSDDHLHGGGN